MTMTIENKDAFASAFDEASPCFPAAPEWLRALREKAWARFGELGFPTRKDEDWGFTSVKAIAQGEFRLPTGAVPSLNRKAIEPFLFEGEMGPLLVFVDGRYAKNLSSLGTLPAGVTIASLADAVGTHGESVRHHLAAYAAFRDDAFAALNTALMTDGAHVHVGKGVVLTQPIHLLFVSTAGAEGRQVHPRNLIVAEANSQVTVVEHYVSLSDTSVYFTNPVTEVAVGENATVAHYLIERESASAYSVSTLTAHQERSSNFTSHSVMLGGKLVRNNVHPVLDGDGCFTLLNGIYVLRGSQHVDNNMLVEHAKTHGDSRQFYKGILGDESHGVFGGRIIVHEDAQKTDAKQTNTNLLLTDSAHVDTKPQLEIYADDVKCTHGATIGQLDEEAIFYLRARGLTPSAARAMLIHAFVGECLDRMDSEPIRMAMERVILERLPQATPSEPT